MKNDMQLAIDRLVPGAVGDLVDPSEEGTAGIVHQRVDPAIMLQRERDDLLAGRRAKRWAKACPMPAPVPVMMQILSVSSPAIRGILVLYLANGVAVNT